MERRTFLKILASLPFLSGEYQVRSHESVLTYVRELPFNPGTKLGTTFFPRKICWELTGDSEWTNHTDVVGNSLRKLAENGISTLRLVVVPFEKDLFARVDWLLDTADSYGLTCDLCAGPVDYPYGPAGVRVPAEYQDAIKGEFELSLRPHPLRDWALDFTNRIFERYGNSSRVGRFYLGNEWPDRHEIEGVPAFMTISEGFMLEVAKIAKEHTDKPLVLNTNIHPKDRQRLVQVYGRLFELLGSQGVLGIDTYPTEEKNHQQYGSHITNLRNIFGNLEFTEYQAEPWSKQLSGMSWDDILSNHRQAVDDYYMLNFAPSLVTHMIASNIQRVSLWGAPLWLIAEQRGYKFPLDLVSAIAANS